MFPGPFIFQMSSSGLFPVDPHLSGSVVLATGQLSGTLYLTSGMWFTSLRCRCLPCRCLSSSPWLSLRVDADVCSEARGAIHLTKCRRSFQHGMNHSSIDFTEQISIESKRSLEQLAHCGCLFYIRPHITRWLPRLLLLGAGQKDYVRS